MSGVLQDAGFVDRSVCDVAPHNSQSGARLFRLFHHAVDKFDIMIHQQHMSSSKNTVPELSDRSFASRNSHVERDPEANHV